MKTEPIAPGIVPVLVQNHRSFLAFVEKRVGSREAAEEILQAAFVKSVERAGTIREAESAVAWFYRVLRNAIADHFRHRAATEAARERLATEAREEPAPDPELRQAVCRCVTELLPTLKPEYGDMLRRVEIEEARISEVAQELGISANNATVRLHRARRALLQRVRTACGTCAEHGCLECECGSPRSAG